MLFRTTLVEISEEECLCRRNGRGGGCGGEEGRQQERVITVWLVYLLLMGYNSGYVFRQSCNCVLRSDVRGRIYKCLKFVRNRTVDQTVSC